MSRVCRRSVAALCAFAVLASACGGGDDGDDAGGSGDDTTPPSEPAVSVDGGNTDGGSTDGGSTDGNSTDESDSDGAETPDSAGGDPIEGSLVSLLSFDFGLYEVERGTGETRALSIDGVGFSDRDDQPILHGDAAYTLTFTTIDGQTFSNEVGVGRFELATGAGEEIVRLGVDRTDDEAEDLTSFTLLGADRTRVWVESKPFAQTDPALVDYVAYDIADGTEVARLTNVAHEESGDGGDCSDSVRNVFVGSDGSLIGTSFGWPVSVDPSSGDVTPLVVSCLEFDQPTLLSIVGAEAAEEFIVVEDDVALDAESLEAVADATEPTVADALVEGDGSLWWVFNSTVSAPVDDGFVSTIVGGVARYDLAEGEIVELFPLGDAVGEFLGDDEIGDVTTLSQMDLQYLVGSLWIMDRRENQPLRRVDGATGAVTDIDIPLGEGDDAVEARLIPNDPEAIWLDVTRKVVEVDDGGRSSSGEGFIDQIDVSTDEIVLSVAQSDILGL